MREDREDRHGGDDAPVIDLSAMNDNERKVLAFLAGRPGEAYYPFRTIEAGTRLDRATVRLACRALRTKGLTEFAAGLWTEDGDMAGSGYAATEAGREAAADSALTDEHARKGLFVTPAA